MPEYIVITTAVIAGVLAVANVEPASHKVSLVNLGEEDRPINCLV